MNTTQSPHAERQYLHTLVAGAWLPLAQSTSIAAAVAIGTWVIAYFVFDAVDPHKPAIILFVITWVYTMFKLQRHWLNLTSIEQIFQKDFNGDGVIGEAIEQPKAEAKPRRVVIQIDTVKENGNYQVGDSTDIINFPCSDDQLYTLAQGLLNGMPFSEKTWTGNGKPFSIQEFRDLKIVMFKKRNGDKEPLIEYVSEKDKRQGIRLTATGKKVMEQIATSPTPA
jgi:hypothetical protein